MPAARTSRTRVAAAALAAALAGGCAHKPPDEASGDRKPDAREQCRMSFRACAPPASFAPGTDVGKLSVRRLVQLSARLDVDDDLAEKAAKRLDALATKGDAAALLEMESALDDARPWSEKCRCKEFRSELEKRNLPQIVAGRLPSRESRTPEHWVDGILARIDAVRTAKRRAAELVNAGDTAGSGGGETKIAEAQRDLCETVHAARTPLAPDAYESLLQMVYEGQKARSGEGSAEVAKGLLDEVRDSTDCGGEGP
jgi:hypothetical protein